MSAIRSGKPLVFLLLVLLSGRNANGGGGGSRIKTPYSGPPSAAEISKMRAEASRNRSILNLRLAGSEEPMWLRNVSTAWLKTGHLYGRGYILETFVNGVKRVFELV